VCMCTHAFQISSDGQISFFPSTRWTHLLNQNWYMFTNMMGPHLAESKKYVKVTQFGSGGHKYLNSIEDNVRNNICFIHW